MNIPEATKLYTAMSLLNPYAKARTDEEIVAMAEQIASLLPNTPLAWAMEFVQGAMRNGQIPSVTDIAAAWGPEARRRVEAVPVPPAPAEIEDDPEAWRAWEKARRAALVQGANQQQAINFATRQIAATGVVRGHLTSGRAPATSTEAVKADVKNRLREWAERQRTEQHDMLGNGEGGAQ